MATENTSTALATAPAANPGRELALYGMDADQKALIKRTVAKGATDDQLALFLVTAKRLGLDPFARQIYCVLRPTKDGGVDMAIQTGIDGFRAIALRTGECDGQEGPWWCGEDGVWKDVWLAKEPPRAAKVVVYRKGAGHPFVGVASWDSYVQVGKDGKPSGKWPGMPDVMLAKCAEALALRKAFPVEMGGVYTEDEMDHANAIDVPSVEKIVVKNAEPEVDPWGPFLADLAGAPGAAQFAEGFGTPVAQWTEAEITEAWTGIIGEHDTRRALNAALGPWSAIVNLHAARSGRVAKLKDALGVPYLARIAQLRAAEQAAAGASS